jgi:hypothetical protein
LESIKLTVTQEKREETIDKILKLIEAERERDNIKLKEFR